MDRLSFEGLLKVPPHPAARILASAGAELKTRLQAPASASVQVVMRELAQKNALFDLLHLMAVALPAREAVWWACLAARDLLERGQATPSLQAAEAWVLRPDAAARARAQRAMDGAGINDETIYCALAAVYADGTMGEGELASHAAPPGAVGAAVLTMNVKSLLHYQDAHPEHGIWLIARGLDIARGGNGEVGRPAAREALKGAKEESTR